MLRKSFRVLLMLCMILNYPVSGFGQGQTTGAIEGGVFELGTDAVIPGAVVVVINQDTGLERSTVTSGEGAYYISTLPPGFYRISATAPGFLDDPNSTTNNFPVRLAKTNVVQPPPIRLARTGVPQPTPIPQVAGTEVERMVNTTNATRGGNFDTRQLLALPLSGIRTFDQLAFLEPGVAPPPLPIGSNVGPGIGPGVGTSGQFSVNGLRSRANNFTIDGADNNDEEVGVRRQGFTSLVPQPIESIQEFQISTLLPEPQFGRNMAAQVNAVSRSGGSEYHGTVYGFFTDRRLKARDAFDFTGGPPTFTLRRGEDGTPVQFGTDFIPGTLRPFELGNPVREKNPFTRSQYGFAVGGPIAQDRLHFFGSFERQDINASRESHFAVPTIAQRGLFQRGAIGLTIDGGRQFSSSLPGMAFLSLFPFPNNPMGPYGANTYSEELPASADGTVFSFKLDSNFDSWGGQHQLGGRYNFTDDSAILPVTGEALFSSLEAMVRTQNVALILNTALSPRTANQFRFSYGRTSLEFGEVRNPFLIPSRVAPNEPFLLNAPMIVNATLRGAPTTLFQVSGLDSEGGFGPIPGLANTGTGPLGQVKVSGFSSLGVDVFSFPQGRTNNTFQFADTAVMSRGRHRLTAGFDTRLTNLNSFLNRNFRPLAVFSGAIDVFGLTLPVGRRIPEVLGAGTCVPESCFYLGTDYLAAGAATGFFQSLANGNVDSRIRLRYWQHNFFFSDQIRVRPNFNLTLGLRYEFNTVPTEKDRRIENTFSSAEVQTFIDIERQFSEAFSGRAVSGLEQFLAGRDKIFDRDTNNFAPHIAFAWDPFNRGTTALRGGYGIYYDQILGAVVSQSRNVFPTFLTINLGGFNTLFDPNRPGETALLPHPFVPVNPANIFAVPGTLNTFDTGLRGDPVVNLLASALLTNLAGGPGFVLPARDLVTPYSQHWTLTLEHQFQRDYLISVGYVGTRGVHLLRFATPNLGPNAIPIVTSATVEAPIAGAQNLLFPVLNGISLPPNVAGDLRPFPLLGPFTSIESDANSIYHSLQLQFNKRFAAGIQFTTSYTWSHAIDEVSDLFDMQGALALPQNSLDRAAERADANFDVRHRFVYSLIWDLPIFKESNILGNWQVSSIGTFQTGQPYSVLFCCDINLDGNLTDRVTAEGSLAGEAPRNMFRAPGIATVDLAVNKRFKFTERRSLDFRSEFFNLFNRTHFGIPVNQVLFGGFEARPLTEQIFVDTRVPARTIQFALKYNF